MAMITDSVSHTESVIADYVIATYRVGLPAEVANHLTNTAGIVHMYLAARLCTISTFLMLSEVLWAPKCGGILHVWPN